MYVQISSCAIIKDMNISSIRAFVQATLLQEKAATAKMASNDNLALATYEARDEPGDISYVLFDRNMFVHYIVQEVRKIAKEENESVPDIIEELGYENLLKDRMTQYATKFVMGTIDTEKAWGGPSNDASMVHMPAASKGYGPLMYDIAMAAAGELMPDRQPGVSKSAQQVWKYYKEKRPDVVATPLDDRHNPQTPQKTDDAIVHSTGKENFGNFLDSSYHLKGKGPDVKGLTASFERLEKYLDWNLNISTQDLMDILWTSAEAFYDVRHGTEN